MHVLERTTTRSPATDLPHARRFRTSRASAPSRHDKILVVDIETTPDLARLPRDWKGDFPKPAYHEVRCISYLVASIDRAEDGTESYRVERCASGGEADWSESMLLRGFWSFFEKGDYRLLSWNGRRFDGSVARLRAMLHGIPAPSWYRRGDRWANYGSRYAGWHVDVMDALSDNGATVTMGLDETASLLGLPGKVGAHGSDVASLVEAGKLDEVRAYCECDVLNTTAAYFRWAHHVGLASTAGHDASVDSLLEYLAAERAGRPHLGVFADRWTKRRLGGQPGADPNGKNQEGELGITGKYRDERPPQVSEFAAVYDGEKPWWS